MRRGPAPGLAYAGFWVRTVAFVIDGIALLIVVAIATVIAGIAFGHTGDPRARAVVAFVSAVAPPVYFIAFWVLRG